MNWIQQEVLMLPKNDQNKNHALGVHKCVCMCGYTQETHIYACMVGSQGMNPLTREAIPEKKAHTKNAFGVLVCGNLEAEDGREGDNKRDLLVSLPPVFVLFPFSSTL